MTTSLIDDVANYLCLSQSQVQEMALEAPRTYKKYYIPKKKGGDRQIHHPSKKTKSLQYAIMHLFLSNLNVNTAAKAYVRGIKKPIYCNAKLHAQLPYTVKIDFTDFFPSITPDALEKTIRMHDKFKKISKSDVNFLKNACFVRYRADQIGLGIGAPSSPIISNVVMYELDEIFTQIAKSFSSVSIYSRYADDITFSTNIKNACSSFYEQVETVLTTINIPSLAINKSKTIYCDRSGKRQITGLIITPNGEISIGRKNKRYIKSLLFNFRDNKLNDKLVNYLKGYISFILDNEPDFYNSLAIKYGGALLSELKKA